MWVRTQDKKRLLKVNNFEIDVDTIITNIPDGFIVLGEYRSHEKALEVLDVIEDFIEENDVFEMPEDKEGR